MEKDNKEIFQFSKLNYQLLIGGCVILLIGFILMAGGKPETPEVFNEEVFSFRRVTLAPLVCLAGFSVVLYAIMKKPAE